METKLHPGSQFVCFVLQAMNSGLWEDVSSEPSLERILLEREKREKFDPDTSFRLQSEYVYPPTQALKRRVVKYRKGIPAQRKPE